MQIKKYWSAAKLVWKFKVWKIFKVDLNLWPLSQSSALITEPYRYVSLQ